MRTDIGLILASLIGGAALLSVAACNGNEGGGDFNWFTSSTCASAAFCGSSCTSCFGEPSCGVAPCANSCGDFVSCSRGCVPASCS